MASDKMSFGDYLRRIQRSDARVPTMLESLDDKILQATNWAEIGRRFADLEADLGYRMQVRELFAGYAKAVAAIARVRRS